MNFYHKTMNCIVNKIVWVKKRRFFTGGIAALFVLLLFPGCEKDDICVEAGTPHLIIRFYDKDNVEEAKEVTRLRVTGDGLTTPYINRVTTDSIAIPLRQLGGATVFSFISDSEDDMGGMEIGNTDTVTFSYATGEFFVSRACGYTTYYTDLDATVDPDADNWIVSAAVVKPIISDESTAHIHIYH